MSEHRFSTPEALDSALCENVSNRLGQALARRGAAYLVVSGGSTPRGLFGRLANADLEWSKVTVLLADERWVSTTHPDCNESLVRRTLLQNKAAAANFQSLLQKSVLFSSSRFLVSILVQPHSEWTPP